MQISTGSSAVPPWLRALSFPAALLASCTPPGAAPPEQEPAASAAELRDASSGREDEPAQAEARWTQPELEAISAEIQRDLEEIRGERYVSTVAVRIASRADLLAYIEGRQAKFETPERMAGDETIAKLLGVIAHDLDLERTFMDLYESQVAGFYDPSTKSFFLMEGMQRGVARVILAHELGHALDDQLFDLDGELARLGSDSDTLLAYRSVVEGSGTAVMAAWMMDHMQEVDLTGMGDLEKEQGKALADAPTWLWKPLAAAYLQGQCFLANTENLMEAQMARPSSYTIRRAFEQRPLSCEQILHPAKYWNEDERDDPSAVRIGGAVPEGWQVLREDTLGELELAILCTGEGGRGGLDASDPAAMLGLRFTNDAAKGWDGDRVILLGKDGARYMQLATVWDSPRDAAEFYGAMTQQLPAIEKAAAALAGGGSRRSRSGAELAYGDTEDAVLLTVWSGAERRDLRKLEKALASTIERR